jgi:5-methylcytosine-specific restriction endonuclease McrA
VSKLSNKAKSKLIQSIYIAAQGGKCAYCGCKIRRLDGDRPPLSVQRTLLERYATWDHVVPLSKGGKNTICNMVCVCAPCNLDKNDRLPTDSEYRAANWIVWKVVRELMGMSPSMRDREKVRKRQIRLVVGARL